MVSSGSGIHRTEGYGRRFSKHTGPGRQGLWESLEQFLFQRYKRRSPKLVFFQLRNPVKSHKSDRRSGSVGQRACGCECLGPIGPRLEMTPKACHGAHVHCGVHAHTHTHAQIHTHTHTTLSSLSKSFLKLSNQNISLKGYKLFFILYIERITSLFFQKVFLHVFW